MSAASSAGKRSPAIRSNGPGRVGGPEVIWPEAATTDCDEGADGGGGGGGGGEGGRSPQHLVLLVQVQDHRLQAVAFLLQLQVQLADDLHLDAGLRRRIVAIDVVRVQVAVEVLELVEHPLAAGPAAGTTAEQRMDRGGTRPGRARPITRRCPQENHFAQTRLLGALTPEGMQRKAFSLLWLRVPFYTEIS
uniref:Uncharacterized protein n=1 Tax=Anopheles farauti TaxID=69004 RepID=A0A182QWH5_9DIPT